jgi:copper homeostasis protein (lipoprotein)
MSVRILACALAVVLPLAGAQACGKAEAPAAEPQKPTEPLFKPIDPATVTDAQATPGLVRYWGILPCADCSGIRTELQLVQDPKTGAPQSYELTETHLKEGSDIKPDVTRGKWTITRGMSDDPNATMFTLDGGGRPELSRRFERLNDQELRQLDRSGKRIVSSNNYTLTRVSQTIAFTDLKPPAGPAPSPLSPGGPMPAAMVSDMASGWPISLTVGQEMTARLTADAAGRWSMRQGSDGGVVALQGDPTTDRPAGQPAVEVFRLKATKPGKTTITFDLKKGSDAAAEKSVSYPLTVQ